MVQLVILSNEEVFETGLFKVIEVMRYLCGTWTNRSDLIHRINERCEGAMDFQLMLPKKNALINQVVLPHFRTA